MALASSSLAALKELKPSSLNSPLFSFFEFLKYETDDLRSESFLLKDDLIKRYINSGRKMKNFSFTSLRKEFENFYKVLEKLGMITEGDEAIEDVKWERITEICNILRKIETSDEKKVRWALLHLLEGGRREIPISQVKLLLEGLKIQNFEKMIHKIIKTETESGLDSIFDGEKLLINTEEKLAKHYFADAIDEKSRRSPGEVEKEILELLDEGSYSNQEISRILELDEAMVSRVMTKLRNQNKLVLSSFGIKGFRYYSTNCQNCPFGKTYSSCRKDAISYIVNAFKEAYDIDLTSKDFEEIEYNQALINIKKTMKMAKKYSMTNLESNMYENFERLLRMVVKNSIKNNKNKSIRTILSSQELSKLPKLYQMGLKAGMDYEFQLVNNQKNQSNKAKTESVRPFTKNDNKVLKALSR